MRIEGKHHGHGSIAPSPAPPNPSRGIFVLGMHRSGTSALTRFLNLLGAHLGEDLLPANRGNEAGHWESLPVVEINERLLSALGRRWDDLREFDLDWLELSAVRVLQAEARQLLKGEFLGHPLWAVKDPRFGRLMPFWRRAAESVGADVRAIIAVRDPAQVVASLVQRDRMATATAALLWYQHTAESITASEGLPRGIVDYSALMRDWRQVEVACRPVTGVCETPDEQTATLIDGFLDHGLWHERDPSAVREVLPRCVTELYSVLTTGDAEIAFSRARTLIAEVDSRSGAHAGALGDLWVHRERLWHRVMVLETQASADRAQARSEEFEALMSRLDAVNSHLSQADWVNAELNQQRANLQSELDLAREQLASCEEKRRMGEEAARAQDARIEELMGDIGVLQRAVGELELSNSELSRRLAQQVGEADERWKRITQLDQLLHDKSVAFDQARAELGRLRHVTAIIQRSRGWRLIIRTRKLLGLPFLSASVFPDE